MISQLKNTKGFTLIELMIVVAIVGILAAVGLPAYQDYTIRAQVTEGLTLADGLKTPVSEAYQNTGTLPATNADANIQGTVDGQYVSSVAVGANGVITATFSNAGTYKANAAINGKAITLKPDVSSGGSIKWTCEAPTSGGVDSKYLPKTCQ